MCESAVHHRAHDFYVSHFRIRDVKQVLLQNHEVRELADFQRSDLVSMRDCQAGLIVMPLDSLFQRDRLTEAGEKVLVLESSP